MFFLITTENKRMPEHTLTYWRNEYQGNPNDDMLLKEVHSHDGVKIKLDKGWDNIEDSNHILWYKGFSTERYLGEIVADKKFTPADGSYCIIVYDKHTNVYSIHHDTCKSFYIFCTEDSMTNLYPSTIMVDYDEKVILTKDKNIEISSTASPFVAPDEVDNTLSIDETLENIEPLFYKKIDGLMKYNDVKNIKITNTGGLDSLLVCALFKDIDFEMQYRRKPRRWQEGNLMMEHLAEQYWGFHQSKYYEEKTWAITGFWGDAFLMRSPIRVYWILKYYGIDLTQEYNKNPDTYMEGAFQKRFLKQISENDFVPKTKKELYNNVLVWAARDCQIWHVDNTMNFAPLKGLDIVMETLKMSNEALLEQVTDGTMQKRLIAKIDSSLLDQLNKYKNNNIPQQ